VRRTPLLAVAMLSLFLAPLLSQQKINATGTVLPTGKTLAEVDGRVGKLNSFPATIALTPDRRYAAMLHAGYGTQQTRGCQSISVFDFSTGKVADFPDDRLCEDAHQSYFMGLVFSADGNHLYASLGSITDATGEKPGDTGNAIAVYGFQGGTLTRERLIKIAPQPLAPGKWVAHALFKTGKGSAIPYPGGMAVVPGGRTERLLVANNLSDNAILLETASGEILARFDLSTNTMVPSSYPYTVTVTRDGRRAWCSLWNASKVAELDLEARKVTRWISLRELDSATAPGSHPTALLLSPDEKLLYVALANADAVAGVSTETGKVERWLSTELREQKYGGTAPIALAQSADGSRLFAANANLNAVAVFDTTTKTKSEEPQSAVGFIPTEWYPSALAIRGEELLVATAKGLGSGPNGGSTTIPSGRHHREHPYIPTLIYGSLAKINSKETENKLAELTRQVEESNRLKAEADSIRFHAAGNPIKHVIYIIKENRTYDQVFGDLKVGNGDPSLTLYGEDITPNEHKLALQFGVLDNFYDSGEVSGDGHVWSTAAITSDYNEKTWPIAYRGHERTYDFEGMVADEFPLEHGIADVDSPRTGYLWTEAASHGLSYRDYGEFISTEFCVGRGEEQPSPKEGTPAPPPAGACEHKVVKHGEALPVAKGAERREASPYAWDIPLIKRSVPTMAELRDHADLQFASFNVDYPDQLRADEFLSEFKEFVQGHGKSKEQELPNLIIMHLPNDHTGGTRPRKPTPSASVADNDLALGRIVEAVSHSPYWDDTVIFVLEDDAQDGADHVDAHRSLALVISKYAPGPSDRPFVDRDFHTTVSLMRTMEMLLGLPPMNLNDGYAPVMSKEFSGAGNQPPFTADLRNRENGLLYRANPAKAAGAKQSQRMDFSRPDAVNTRVLNAILWRDRKGKTPMPAAAHHVIPAGARREDD
jgi:DNA-binding beta-propeller fold protein YncE